MIRPTSFIAFITKASSDYSVGFFCASITMRYTLFYIRGLFLVNNFSVATGARDNFIVTAPYEEFILARSLLLRFIVIVPGT